MGPYKSGEKIKATFSWKKIGSYSVSVKARDIHGGESDWGFLEVKMPIFNANIILNKINSFNFFNKKLFNIIF